jgi:hypothetical protein
MYDFRIKRETPSLWRLLSIKMDRAEEMHFCP